MEFKIALWTQQLYKHNGKMGPKPQEGVNATYHQAVIWTDRVRLVWET